MNSATQDQAFDQSFSLLRRVWQGKRISQSEQILVANTLTEVYCRLAMSMATRGSTAIPDSPPCDADEMIQTFRAVIKQEANSERQARAWQLYQFVRAKLQALSQSRPGRLQKSKAPNVT